MTDRSATEGYATYDQYATLAKMLENRGTMPADLAALCHLLYHRQYATLSYDDANDLMKRIAEVPPEQHEMRQWISTMADLLAGRWVKGDLDA